MDTGIRLRRYAVRPGNEYAKMAKTGDSGYQKIRHENCPEATVKDQPSLWLCGCHSLWFGDGLLRIKSVIGHLGELPWVVRQFVVGRTVVFKR